MDPQPLDEGPRPKSGKSRLNLEKPFWRESQFVQTKEKEKSFKESSEFGEPRWKLGYNLGSNSRIQFASNESKLVPMNLDPGPSSKVGQS